MTPAELREAVARTLCEEADFDPDADWSLPSFLRKADAVIATMREALREPTPEMVGSAQERKSALDGATLYHGIWRAMLAASPLGGGHE